MKLAIVNDFNKSLKIHFLNCKQNVVKEGTTKYD